MARKFLTALDLAQNELQNARVQNLASAPSSPVKGQLYMNTSDNTLYWWDGTAWQAAKSGTPTLGAVTAETAAFGSASADGVATSVSRSDHKHGNPTHDAAAHSAISLSALAVPTADVAWNSKKITGLLDPTGPQDAATKAYVDAIAQGLDVKTSVRIATTVNHALTGLAAIDGVTPIANDRILVKNQSTASANGIYLAASGAWSRATDMDNWLEVPGAFVFVEEGTTQADTGWVCTANAGGTIGSTAIAWTQFSGAGTYIAGAGLTLTGNILDFQGGAGFSVAADLVDLAFTSSGGTNGVATTVARGDHTHPTKFSANVGGSVTAVVNHALGSKDVQVAVYRVASPFDEVDCDIEHTDTANVTLRFTTAPAAAEYRCVVMV